MSSSGCAASPMPRRTRKRSRPAAWLIAAVVLALAAWRLFRVERPVRRGEARCVRVVDGDTVVLSGLGKVRLVGVDTPERGRPGYAEAKRFTQRETYRKLLRVEICPVRSRDRYGRLRVLLYPADQKGGECLNIRLLKAGLANVYTLPPCHVDTEEWLQYERQARAHGVGLWAEGGEGFGDHSNNLGGSSPATNSATFIGNRKTRVFHRPDCLGLPVPSNRLVFPSAEEARRQGYHPCTRCRPDGK